MTIATVRSDRKKMHDNKEIKIIGAAWRSLGLCAALIR
jgi:hypothetical protein